MQNIYRIAELTPNLEVRYVLANSVPAIYIRGVGTSDFGAACREPGVNLQRRRVDVVSAGP